jgi:hypothetical protein
MDSMNEEKGKSFRKGAGVAKMVSETIAPPPPGFVSPFKSLFDWLNHICETNQAPEKAISEYHFGLLTSPGDNLVFLLGYNTVVSDERIIRRIDFKPDSHVFFALPNDLYGHTSEHELKSQLLNELNEFIKSEKFKQSFLSKGSSVTTNFGTDL